MVSIPDLALRRKKIFWNLRPSGRYFSNGRPIGIGLGHGCAALPRREESFDCVRNLARCLIAPLRRSERQSIFFVGKVAEFQKDGWNVGRFENAKPGRTPRIFV